MSRARSAAVRGVCGLAAALLFFTHAVQAQHANEFEAQWRMRALVDEVGKCRALSESELRLACFDILVGGKRGEISQSIGHWTYKRAIVQDPPGLSLQLLSPAVAWAPENFARRSPYLIFSCRRGEVVLTVSVPHVPAPMVAAEFVVEGRSPVSIRQEFGYDLRIKHTETVRQVVEMLRGGTTLRVTVTATDRGGNHEIVSTFRLDGFDEGIKPLRDYCAI